MGLFERQISLLIGPAGAEQGVEINNLRVVFQIKKNEKPETNTATISVFNLSKDTRSKFKKDDVLILNCGYAQHLGVQKTFVGNIQTIQTVRAGADVVTKFDCKDGGVAIRDTVATLSYKEGASAKEILGDLIKKIPAVSGYFDPSSFDDKKFTNGFSFSGLIKFAMDKVSDKLGLNWSIQDNELQVVKKGRSKQNRSEAILIKAETGLIGSPEKIDLSEENDVERPGWRVMSLLLPKVAVEGLVSLESQEIPAGSIFRVVNIEHRGDTYSNEWNTSLEVEEPTA